MRRILAIASAVLVAAAAVLLAQTPISATTVMKNTAAKLNEAKSLTVRYVVQADDNSLDGTMIIAGSSFMADTKEMKIWYDGVTQWTWSARTDEVTITEPELDELMESNPFAILNNFEGYYNCRLLASPKGTRVVELVPKSDMSAISKAVVTVNCNTWWPERIVVDFDGGSTADVAISSITPGKKLPASTFKYNRKSHPAKKVIDLR